jgi:UDP-glucose 4-epimerase
MLNILVTGAGGYIGSHVTKKLLQDGHKVIAFDNFSCGFREPLELIAKYGSLRVIEGDICNKEDIDRVFKQTKIDLVMHFAALCSVAESMKNPGLYFKNNVYGSLNLFESMRENEVNKIIFSSTCAVYGDATNLPINEQHVTQPKNPYGESKRMIGM